MLGFFGILIGQVLEKSIVKLDNDCHALRRYMKNIGNCLEDSKKFDLLMSARYEH